MAEVVGKSLYTELPIAVDVMGGDRGPDVLVSGARRAVEEFGLHVVLYGDRNAIGDTGELPFVQCNEVITMEDEPARAVRSRQDASTVRVAEAVRDGKAVAMISAANTGATMISALLRLGRLPGVDRPAIAVTLPSEPQTVFADAGVNVDYSALQILQIAAMSAQLHALLHPETPTKIGLLANGTESTKGTKQTKEALKAIGESTVLDLGDGRQAIFVGNIEGNQLWTPAANVIVTDGFTGNIALKIMEGDMAFFIEKLMALAEQDDKYREALDILMPGLLGLYAELHPDRYGAAPLLGLNGLCMIAHGNSSEEAYFNGIRLTAELANLNLISQIAIAIANIAPIIEKLPKN